MHVHHAHKIRVQHTFSWAHVWAAREGSAGTRVAQQVPGALQRHIPGFTVNALCSAKLGMSGLGCNKGCSIGRLLDQLAMSW